MVYIGIDVSKNKHDCFITNSNGEYYTNLLQSPTVVKVLKLCFKESNPYLMILQR